MKRTRERCAAEPGASWKTLPSRGQDVCSASDERLRVLSAYLVVDDAAVALEGRQVRPGRSGGGFRGPLLDARVVGVPGSAAEVAVVHEEQAGTQKEHEEHSHPMALKTQAGEDR